MGPIPMPEETLADKKLRLRALVAKIGALHSEIVQFDTVRVALRKEIKDIEDQMAVTLF